MKGSEEDYAAYQSLYTDYSAIIYGIILKFMKDETLAVEALAAVFLEINKDGFVTARRLATTQTIVRNTYKVVAEILGRTMPHLEAFKKLREGLQLSPQASKNHLARHSVSNTP